MSNGETIVTRAKQAIDLTGFREQNWTGTFAQYLDIVRREPRVTRTAFERIYDMILAKGVREYVDSKKKIVHYNFFDDLDHAGEDAIYGLDIPLMKLVNIFKSAAQRYGTERRVILLHGPVGSSKSTIARLLKKGLEAYSKIHEGALYTFGWVRDLDKPDEVVPCPMHEEPLHLVPRELRAVVLDELNSGKGVSDRHVMRIEGDLCPFCRQEFRELMTKYNGDWTRVLAHVQVRRLLLSSQDRIGIGTFQPKDEKNQDSTELTGDINYRKIAEYGSDSDPRAFNFDGEFNIANRGMIEFIEVLKLDVAFLYELLGASQEHLIKPKKFPQTWIDEVILGHTNEPEYRRLQNNEYMEALRDRTVKVDIPYVTKLSEEIKIYEKLVRNSSLAQAPCAPGTLRMMAQLSVLTRLKEPENSSTFSKMQVYDGENLKDTDPKAKSIQEYRDYAGVDEGMSGVSTRFAFKIISKVFNFDSSEVAANPVHLMYVLEQQIEREQFPPEIEQKYISYIKELLAPRYAEFIGKEIQTAYLESYSEYGQNIFDRYVTYADYWIQDQEFRDVDTGEVFDRASLNAELGGRRPIAGKSLVLEIAAFSRLDVGKINALRLQFRPVDFALVT